MAESDLTKAMDDAAEHARRELVAHFSQWNAAAVSRWWNKWQPLAGDERLGRILRELHDRQLILRLPETALSKSVAVQVAASPPKSKVRPQSTSLLQQVSRAKTLILRAEKTALRDLQNGLVKDEEGVTERLIGAIHHEFNFRIHKGVRWSAMTLTAHKRNAQETTVGADLLGVLQISLKDYSVQKGFLAQAKLLRGSNTLKPSEFERLKQQCEKMLNYSTESYVFLYENHHIFVIRALAAVSLRDSKRLPELERRTLGQFFEQHFNCFVGDKALDSASDATLEKLREKVSARHAVLLSGTSDNSLQ